jgi:putative transposase
MDGRGRVLDNVFIERLWRSVKYEDVYLHNYSNATALLFGLSGMSFAPNVGSDHRE